MSEYIPKLLLIYGNGNYLYNNILFNIKIVITIIYKILMNFLKSIKIYSAQVLAGWFKIKFLLAVRPI